MENGDDELRSFLSCLDTSGKFVVTAQFNRWGIRLRPLLLLLWRRRRTDR